MFYVELKKGFLYFNIIQCLVSLNFKNLFLFFMLCCCRYQELDLAVILVNQKYSKTMQPNVVHLHKKINK